MDKENLSGEKALIEERRKNLSNLEIREMLMVILLNLKTMQANFMRNMEFFQRKI